ncbi:hypothetical protein EUTSA_v10012172mg [Eutrema salsugineum]|uniref:F-box domain-containing protein n=1 Tax=Eutrema salsugineum TaxID=72664 RepID=V4MHD9_EUTSA|nr:hypothetical protein EUTSA_v10012172mg [Eutrema salsugineum]
MNILSLPVLNEIFFRLNPKSLAKMQCTCKFIKSHISEDPKFKSEYLFWFKSSLLQRFRFLNHSEWRRPKCIGLTVDQIDQTTQEFKIVRIISHHTSNRNKNVYLFEIYTVDSWRLSRTTIMCLSSEFMTEMKPVYLDGTLHWLRNDRTRHIIPSKPHLEPVTKILFAVGDNRLTLISATMEMIYVFTLESIHTNLEWILTRQIRNEAVNESITLSWDVKAYDGKCLVVRMMTNLTDHRVNKWRIVGSMPRMCDGFRDFYMYQPLWSSVIGVDQDGSVIGLLNQDGLFTIVKPGRVSSVEGIIRLINRNI